MRQPETLDTSFSTVRTEGGLLPADILAKILAGDSALPGTSAEAYHLPKGEKLGEAINRSWSRVRSLWEKFRQQRETLVEGDTGTSQSRETLLLPLFTELGYGRLLGAKTEDRTVGDKVFSISHFWHHSPVHLIGCKLELDRRAKGVRGAAQSSPHSMVQDFLNRSDAHLWGFCSNGLCLRILRDNNSLSRQAFIEFDLESMFEGEVFSDFALLWMLCHQSRVENDEPASCWLEQWAKSAQDQGVRALDTLRSSVQKTIEILGQGFLESRNPELKERLRSGALSRQDYFRQLLRLVYRFLFLFAAEDRGLLHTSGTPEQALKRFSAWHSTTRLRHLAGKLSGTKHHDLYEGLKLVMGYLGRSEGCPELGLSPLGSFLWSDEALPDVSRCCLSNGHFLQAVRALAYTETDDVRRPVDYKNVGARELGSIYESLLELHPILDSASGAFRLETASGNERKTTGSYYTPTPLIESLLDSALEPIIKQAFSQENPEAALLELKICDPACGSGHFLIAAAHRLAKRLATVRTEDEEPSPGAMRKALRDVIGRCVYGVDVNPMAVELCKVSLWLEALEPGKPLSFLDHHIRCGNSLIGSTPELIADGLPDEAFSLVEGDEKIACSALKKINNAAKKKAQLPLLAEQEKEIQALLRTAAAALEAIPSDSMQDIQSKEIAFRQHENTPAYQAKRDIADAWCAAFIIRKYFPQHPGSSHMLEGMPIGITQRELTASALGHPLQPEIYQEVKRLADQYQFFHWHLVYPEVFANGGFDVIVGNPPWEMVESFESETGKNDYSRVQNFYKSAPFSILKGKKDFYKLFLVKTMGLLKTSGLSGFIIPLGIFVEESSFLWRNKVFFNGTIVKISHFQNIKKIFFNNVHASYRFCNYIYSPDNRLNHEFTTVISSPESIDTTYTKTVLRSEFTKKFGNSWAAAIYPTAHYAKIHNAIENELLGRGIAFKIIAEFHASTDKALIRKFPMPNGCAVLKNRNIHLYSPQYSPYEGWVSIDDTIKHMKKKGLTEKNWEMCFTRLIFRDIARNDDERTLISCLVPYGVVSSYDTPMFFPECPITSYHHWIAFYAAAFSSFVVDFLIRPYVDKHVKGYTLERITWPSPNIVQKINIPLEWISKRVLELCYTDYTFQSYAQNLGFDCPPFSCDEERRFHLRCELDAVFFHLYLPANQEGTWEQSGNETAVEFYDLCEAFPSPRHAVDYIMDSFTIVKRKDESAYGEYRTKQTILQMYDAMQEAISTGKVYESRVTPHMEIEASIAKEEREISEIIAAPAYKPSAAQFPYWEREKRVNLCITALMRDHPGLTFDDYFDAMVLATCPKDCAAMLPLHQREAFIQTLATTGLEWEFAATDKVRFHMLKRHLTLLNVSIRLDNRACRMPDNFDFRDAPSMTTLGKYLFEALTVIRQHEQSQTAQAWANTHANIVDMGDKAVA